jgi:hypothetical protein
MSDNENKPVDDALAAMANGADLDESEGQDEALTPDAIAAIIAAGGTVPEQTASEPAVVEAAALADPFAMPPPTASARAAVAAVSMAPAQRKAAFVHSHTYKGFLVPLLLVFGILLLIISVLSVVFCAPAPGPDGEPVRGFYLLPPEGKWLALIAGPLALILLAGAWMFHQEVRKGGK